MVEVKQAPLPSPKKNISLLSDAPELFRSLPVETLTLLGNNFNPRFSPKGDFFIFISRNRETHPHSQLYRYDFSARTEKRWTFQDGEIRQPHFLGIQDHVIFSSNTDRLKEKLDIKQFLDSTPNGDEQKDALFEIYVSKVDGGWQRVTKNSVGEFFPTEQGQRGVFVLGAQEILQLNLKTGQFTPFLSGRAAWMQSLSLKGGALLWAEGENENLSVIQYLAKPKTDILTPVLEPRPQWDPSWVTSDDFVFSAARLKVGEAYESDIYDFNLKTQCLRRLTYFKGAARHPDISPDRKYLLFDHTEDGHTQIYRMALSDSIPCASPAPAVK